MRGLQTILILTVHYVIYYLSRSKNLDKLSNNYNYYI